MIAKALTFLTDFLEKELQMSFHLDHKIVVPSSLINPDGSLTSNIENKIVVSVINLEHETFMKSIQNYKTDASGKFGKVAPPIHLNLYLLVSANYDSQNYLEANKMLSKVISVLQANPYFTRNDNPEMQEPLEKLTLEIFNLPINELSHIWGAIGAKYVPSLIYKVRMITIQEDKIKKEVPAITGLGKSAKAK